MRRSNAARGIERARTVRSTDGRAWSVSLDAHAGALEGAGVVTLRVKIGEVFGGRRFDEIPRSRVRPVALQYFRGHLDLSMP